MIFALKLQFSLRRRNMAKGFFKRRRNDILYALIYCIIAAAKHMPRRAGLILFGMLGRLFFLIQTVDKKRTIEQLTRFYSRSWPKKKIMQTASAVYANLGKNFFDTIFLSRCSHETFYSIVSHDDLGEMEHAYNQGNGIICITSHSGCFEMMIHIIARKGFKCVTIGQKAYDSRVDKLIVSLRTLNNITYLHRDKSSREILRLLRKGYAFGTLLDQDTNVDGVFAHFMGKLAYTPSGPLRIALHHDIPVFCAYTYRQKDNSHHIVISERIELEHSGDKTRDLVHAVEKVNSFLSRGILGHPDQWVWMHRRWHKQPHDQRYAQVPRIDQYV